MKEVKITLKTSKGVDDVSFHRFITKEYLTDAVILKYGFPLNTEFEFNINDVKSSHRNIAFLFEEGDIVELTVKE